MEPMRHVYTADNLTSDDVNFYILVRGGRYVMPSDEWMECARILGVLTTTHEFVREARERISAALNEVARSR
jgi:hypothetical protein